MPLAHMRQWGRGRGSGRERISSSLCAERGAGHGVQSPNPEIMT